MTKQSAFEKFFAKLECQLGQNSGGKWDTLDRNDHSIVFWQFIKDRLTKWIFEQEGQSRFPEPTSLKRVNRYVKPLSVFSIGHVVGGSEGVGKEKVVGVKALMQGWLTLTNSVNFVRKHIYRKEIARGKFFLVPLHSWDQNMVIFFSSPALQLASALRKLSRKKSHIQHQRVPSRGAKKTKSPKLLISFFFLVSFK